MSRTNAKHAPRPHATAQTAPQTAEGLLPAQLEQRLGSLLASYSAAYDTLARLTAEHRDAIRAADAHAIARSVESQHAVLRELGRCDQVRRELIASATASFPALRATPADRLSLRDLARCTPASHTLLAQAESLRAKATQVQASATVLKAAANNLLAHMEGMVRQVARSLSHAGTYSRRGVVEAIPGVVSALDIRS